MIQISARLEEQILWGSQKSPQNAQQAEYGGLEEKDKAIQIAITTKGFPHSRGWRVLGIGSQTVSMGVEGNSFPPDDDFSKKEPLEYKLDH